MNILLRFSKIIILFYIIIPSIFYGVVVFLSYGTGHLSFFFYTGKTATFYQLLIIWIGYLILGYLIFKILKKTDYIIYMKKSNFILDSIIILLYVSYILLHINILNMLLFSLLIVLFANYRPSTISFIILLNISLLQMVYNEDRYAVIFILMIWLLPFLSRKNLLSLIILSAGSLFFLVFILQPLRYGIIPFSQGNDFLYIYKHLSPIYLTAVVSNSMDFSFQSLISEVIPFGKSLFNEVGVIDRIANEVLPNEILNKGTRLGSNSAMYFSLIGIPILFYMIFYLKISFMLFKKRLFYNSVLFYFIVQGPYFIRRSFSSYIIDIVLIIFWSLIISMLFITFKKRRVGCER